MTDSWCSDIWLVPPPHPYPLLTKNRSHQNCGQGQLEENGMRGSPQLQEGPSCLYSLSAEGGALGEWMQSSWRAHDLMPFQDASTRKTHSHWLDAENNIGTVFKGTVTESTRKHIEYKYL